MPTSSQRFYIPFTQLFTNLGLIAPGWKMKTYQTGTTIPLATYSDSGLTVPNANPANLGVTTGNQVADENGRLGDMFVASSALYKLVMTDQDDVVIQTTDPVDPASISLATLSPRPLFFAGTTTGTSSAYVLAANPPFTTYSFTDTFELTFHVANSPGAATLQYSATGSALALKKYTGLGTKVDLEAGDVQNQTYIVRNDGVDVVVLNPQKPYLDTINFTRATTAVAGVSYLPNRVLIANNGITPNTSIDFSTGVIPFADGSGQAIATAITKTTGSWAVGNNQGGLFSGSIAANTWYYCFGIYNPTTKVYDAGFDTSTVAANRPATYTKYKYVGAIRTSGTSTILGFVQSDRTFFYNAEFLDLSLAAVVATKTNFAVTVPPIPVIGIYQASLADGNAHFTKIFGSNQVDAIPTQTNSTLQVSTSATRSVDTINLYTLSQTISYRDSTGGAVTNFRVSTLGYVDNNI